MRLRANLTLMLMKTDTLSGADQGACLARLDWLETTYETGWQQSDQSTGDLRFLDGLKWCFEQRLKLIAQAAASTQEELPVRFTLNLGERPLPATEESQPKSSGASCN